jgi:hypothetical protein
VTFGGINRTENIKDGEIRDGAGVTSALYPVLSQSLPFAEDTSYGEGVADMFEHSGILSYVKDGMLYYDGKAVAKVSGGKKQWAVVNTKLCVFPDKIAVDIKDGTVLYMEKEMAFDMAHNGTTITTDKLTVAPVTERVQNNREEEFKRPAVSGAFIHACTYTYGKDQAAVQNCFKKGMWQGLEQYEELKDICYGFLGNHIAAGDILIPQVTQDGGLVFNLVAEKYKGEYVDGKPNVPAEYLPDKARYNSEGYYAVVQSYNTDLDRGADTEVVYDVYKTDGADVLFVGSFEAGDAVTISGTLYGLKDATNIIVSGVDEVENSLVFEPDSVRDVGYYVIVDKQIPGGTALNMTIRGYYVQIVPKTVLMPGTILYTGKVTGTDTNVGTEMTEITVHRWDALKKQIVESYQGEIFDEWVDGIVTASEYTTDSGELTIKVAVPDLDYICESENRLWGVSNETGTIYASELGVPHRFYTYGDSSTDSYAVAVGSEDEFTAICSFGGGVCCFKENKLHKILGSFPAEYYMQEYEIAGVQKGAEKTLCVINEVLLYKGVHGVYAYTGGTPRLISYELGDKAYTATAAGTDGRAYYIGMSGPYQDELLAYDIAHDLWMPDSKILAEAVCSINGKVYILSGGKVYKQTEDIKNSAWRVELVPSDEMMWSKKGYSRIVLKAEMERGSNMSVYIRLDRGHWIRAITKAATMDMTSVIPLHIGRCDRCEIKIEGQGRVMLRGMLREFGEGRI